MTSVKLHCNPSALRLPDTFIFSKAVDHTAAMRLKKPLGTADGRSDTLTPVGQRERESFPLDCS